MLYALLIYEAEEVQESYSEDDLERALRGHRALQERSKKDGAFAEALQLTPAASATALRIRGGRATLTDGPFTETKELLVGLYVMDCDSLEAAIEYAKSIPDAATGTIEIRAVVHHEAVTRG